MRRSVLKQTIKVYIEDCVGSRPLVGDMGKTCLYVADSLVTLGIWTDFFFKKKNRKKSSVTEM